VLPAEGSGMRAPFRESPDWGWDDTDPHLPDIAPVITVMVDEGEDDGGLVDVHGEPLFTEEAPPFGFCSQRTVEP
jgi:hypothetical protein